MVITAVWAVWGGGGASAGDDLEVSALGVCGVLASVGRASMMKRTVGAGGMFLGTSVSSLSESIAVDALGVGVSLRRFLDLDPL